MTTLAEKRRAALFVVLKAKALRLGESFVPDLALLENRFEAIVSDGFVMGFAREEIQPSDLRFRMVIRRCSEHR